MSALALVEDANVTHSETLLAAARRMREEADRLHATSEQLRAIAAQLENSVTGTSGIKKIRGREIITRLVEILEPGEDLHYREMVDLLTLHGYRPGGVSADATLLAALHRSEEFEASPPGSGRWRRTR